MIRENFRNNLANIIRLVDIALNIGCSSQTNFTVLFRKYMGITPKVYRNQI